MKKRATFFLSLAAILWLTTITVSAADEPSAFARAAQQEIMTYMREAGYAPQIDGDGDIVFTYQELNCYIIIEDGDEGELFVKTFIPYVKPEDISAEDANMLYTAINKANEEYRVVKCYYTSDRIIFLVDTWISSASEYTRFFKLYMRGLHHAAMEVMKIEE